MDDYDDESPAIRGTNADLEPRGRRYPEEDTTPTTQRELRGWYFYGMILLPKFVQRISDKSKASPRRRTRSVARDRFYPSLSKHSPELVGSCGRIGRHHATIRARHLQIDC